MKRRGDGCLKAIEDGRAGGFDKGDLVEVVAEEVGRETFRDAVRNLILNIAGSLPSAEEMDEQLSEEVIEDGEQGPTDYGTIE